MDKEERRKKKVADRVFRGSKAVEMDNEAERLRARAQELVDNPKTRHYFDPDAYDLDAGIDRGEITEDDKRAILENSDLFEDNYQYRDEFPEGGNEMDNEYDHYRLLSEEEKASRKAEAEKAGEDRKKAAMDFILGRNK